MMSKEKAPNGRMDMKYVIYRLEEIESEDVSDSSKVISLKFFISELLGKLSQDGQDRTKAPLIY
tara:strand:- start:389 stop:580 length:192 start_codon:yes stop_codon:yes gene_type:complete